MMSIDSTLSGHTASVAVSDEPVRVVMSTIGESEPVASRPEALRCSLVRRHLSLQGLGQVADAAVALTLARLLLEGAASPTSRDITTAIVSSVVPAVVGLPLAWCLADSLRRNASLAATQLTRALISVGAMLVPHSSSRAVGFAFIAAITAAQTVTGSLRTASVGHTVERSRLVAANSLAAVTGKIAGALGLALVFALDFLGPHVVFSTAAALHLLAAVGYASWSADLGGNGQRATSTRQMARDAVQLLRNAGTLAVVLGPMVLRALQAASMVTLVALVDHGAQRQSIATAAVLAATSTGGFIGMAAAPTFWRVFRTRTACWAPIGSLIALGTFVAVHPTLSTCLAVQFGLSMAFGTLRVRADAAVQANCVAASRGRVVAAYEACYLVAFVAGAVLASANPFVGQPLGLIVTVITGAIAITCGFTAPRLIGRAEP